CQQYHYLPWTF
nr:immunoglobulin light chain junction region [Macaca mulatta]MOV74312.1 immunoglobulin light chain junction region [Macaca mulatta]MOV74493.1 immunoglobulin light chain junction region [Macaca mulatta]MOV74927.1 immunoglobulin light chain junction region [Macaca mulatta]MOV75620.1 immunoglobulin light chain junction region [Macaca mulatta]